MRGVGFRGGCRQYQVEVEQLIRWRSSNCDEGRSIFTFAGSSGIDDAMLALARNGMKVKGVLDPAQAKQDWAAPSWLVHNNIKMYVPRRAGVFASLRKLHHKLGLPGLSRSASCRSLSG